MLFSMAAVPFSIPTSSAGGFSFSRYLPALAVFGCFVNGYPNRCEVLPHCGFIYISLMTNDVERLFLYLLAICRSSLGRSLFKSFAHFLINFFLLLSYLLSDIWFRNNFYCSFHSVLITPLIDILNFDVISFVFLKKTVFSLVADKETKQILSIAVGVQMENAMWRGMWTA